MAQRYLKLRFEVERMNDLAAEFLSVFVVLVCDGDSDTLKII